MQKIKITRENEKELLSSLYPLILFKGKKVRYDPQKHQMEKGEIARYLVIETGEIKKGVIKHVALSNPLGFAIYTIGKDTLMYHRVWPNIEDHKKHKADKKAALQKLTRKDREALGV